MRAIVLAGALALAASASGAGTARAQSTYPHSGLRPGLLDAATAADRSAAPPTSDFVARAGGGDQFEIQEGEMASSLAVSAALRAFGVDMAAAHRRMAAALARAATGVDGPAPPPAAPLTADQQAQIDQLRTLRGAAFDRAYLDQQLSAHEEALTLDAAYARGGSDPAVRRAAAAALPQVRDHLRRLDALRARSDRR